MKEKNKFPEITKQEIKYIDSTPDENYPLRILRAYRENCDCFWVVSPCDNPIYEMMNEHQKQRAKILDKAIEKLIR